MRGWQMELLFKLWKSHGGLEALRGRGRSECCGNCMTTLIGPGRAQWRGEQRGPCLAYIYPKEVRRVRRRQIAAGGAVDVVGGVVRCCRGCSTADCQKRCRSPEARQAETTTLRVAALNRHAQRPRGASTEEANGSYGRLQLMLWANAPGSPTEVLPFRVSY